MPFETIERVDTKVEKERRRAARRLQKDVTICVNKSAKTVKLEQKIRTPFTVNGEVTTDAEMKGVRLCGRCGQELRRCILCERCQQDVERNSHLKREAASKNIQYCARRARTRIYDDEASIQSIRKANSAAAREAKLKFMYDPTNLVDRDDFYHFLRDEGIDPQYGRFLREGLRRGDGAMNAGSIKAIQWLQTQFRSTKSQLDLKHALSSSSERQKKRAERTDAARLDLVKERAKAAESAPILLRQLELAMERFDTTATAAEDKRKNTEKQRRRRSRRRRKQEQQLKHQDQDDIKRHNTEEESYYSSAGSFVSTSSYGTTTPRRRRRKKKEEEEEEARRLMQNTYKGISSPILIDETDRVLQKPLAKPYFASKMPEVVRFKYNVATHGGTALLNDDHPLKNNEALSNQRLGPKWARLGHDAGITYHLDSLLSELTHPHLRVH